MLIIINTLKCSFTHNYNSLVAVLAVYRSRLLNRIKIDPSVRLRYLLFV